METENPPKHHRRRRRRRRKGGCDPQHESTFVKKGGPRGQPHPKLGQSPPARSSKKGQPQQQTQKSLPRRKRRSPMKVKAGMPPKSASVAPLLSQQMVACAAGSIVASAENSQKPKGGKEGEEVIWKVEVCQIAMKNGQNIAWSGPVKVLLTASEMAEAVREILASGETHLGFDTETRPNFMRGGWNPTALVQLATADIVYLFRICKLPGYSFEPLLPILTNRNISKTGVSIESDVRALQKVQHFAAAGFVDTTTVTRNVLRIKNGGLQALTYHFMGGRLSKGAQMSNWAVDTLTASQIRYAATDAWISREVHARAVAAVAISET